MRRTPLPFFAAALVPCAIVTPLRFLFFSDASPFTVVLLGPALEEGLKLAALFTAWIAAALVLPRGKDPDNALRYWLFLAPWFVGGAYGLFEGLVVYPAESHLNFTLRELAHGAFTGLGAAVLLWSWREVGRPFVGVALGFGSAWAGHIVFNTFALVSGYVNVSFEEQALVGMALLALAAIALARDVRREPGSPQAASFLAIRGARVRT